MKARDVSKLLRKFHRTGIKNGDLVLTAEIHRVIDMDWGKKHGSRERQVLVSEVFPECSACKGECVHHRVMTLSIDGGQQSIMKLA